MRATRKPFIPHDAALRLARAAVRGAEIHQRLVEVEHVLVRQHRRRQRPQPLLHRVTLRIALADEDAIQHARHVGVENGLALAEREAANRAGGVLADALERQQRLAIARQLAVVVLDRLLRDGLQALRPDVVAERPPRLRSRPPAAPRRARRTTGTSSSHSWYFGSTRSTCVCCSMISETRMWYGSSVVRHGRSRPFLRYHASRLRRNRCRNAGAGSG